MIKFRTRLLFALIMIIFVVLIGLGLLWGQLFKNYYSNTFNERLSNENSLVKTYIEEDGGIVSFNSQKVIRLSKVLDARITLVDQTGKILSDSGELTGSVKAKRHQEIVQNIIKSKNIKKELVETNNGYDLHYYWNPIVKGKIVEGYVITSTEMDLLKNTYGQIWWLLSVSFVVALVVIIILGVSITSRYTKPIESATKVAIELAKGNYRARTYEDHIDETGMLSSSINILARNLQEMMKAKEMQQDRLTTLIENMGSGLLLIDNRGYISLINRAFKENFQVRSSEYLYRLYYEVIEYHEISNLVEEIFITEQKIKRQMMIPLGIDLRHFEVYGAPIIGTNDVWKGILLVFHDITELKNLEQTRKDFVANVSHELKTPITSIKGFTETLLDGAKEDPKSLEAFLNIIFVESERLQTLIEDLLELSKIEQHRFNLEIKSFDLTSIISEVIRMLDFKAVDKGITLEFNVDLQSLTIEGDPFRLKQVFINVINNAIMYTPNGGKITVSIEEKGDLILVKVADTGIGIEKQEIPRIFERFYRVDKARSRNSGGTGLGLAIVKHLIEAHKGTISVVSELGKGSIFTISLKKKLG
ncbi:two-component system histidine kinase PnpS [Bacillus sp. 1NLA3E]|uniref:two-component system histidine kinase PnpS n=1 Tax=Bacillus sp. 1NLA3E TaxID=666686 RepID=UPI000247E917|nr:ATP-binding protein [Bacillus sp. 1NLA3E]AGK55171.1 signal transduction histidine kinase [Bacillus sp. 1NLA3E]